MEEFREAVDKMAIPKHCLHPSNIDDYRDEIIRPEDVQSSFAFMEGGLWHFAMPDTDSKPPTFSLRRFWKEGCDGVKPGQVHVHRTWDELTAEALPRKKTV